MHVHCCTADLCGHVNRLDDIFRHEKENFAKTLVYTCQFSPQTFIKPDLFEP